MKSCLFLLVCLMLGMPALAASPRASAQAKAAPREKPCKPQAPQRMVWPQGTMLWGTARQVIEKETSSVLVSVDVDGVQLGGVALKGARLEDGRLVFPSRKPETLTGAILRGTSSDGKAVEVALCGAEPAADDPKMAWYRIEIWHKESASWQNPCIATNRAPSPRVLAVRGVWDENGARREVPGKFTFACENGAIAKCIGWGYKPWGSKNGRNLEELHQACTRMARADYCGDGRSHTREETPIDMYDGLEVLTRATTAAAGWEPKRASFEAAWAPDGAWCLARTRDGGAVEKILEQCPGRFELREKDLGEGDRCAVSRKNDLPETVLLRNRSYGQGEQLR